MSYTKAETQKSSQPADMDIQYGSVLDTQYERQPADMDIQYGSVLDTQYERHWWIKG
jgi:hypothetical protein